MVHRKLFEKGVCNMGLLDDLKANDKKGLFDSNDTFINYSTGILPLDYANGFWQEVKYPDGHIEHEPITGIMGGTFISIIGATGTGKAQPDSTMIPTPTGYTRLDHLNVGDEVFNRYGKPVKILGVFPQGEKDVYEVTFTDGRSTKCCPEHLWSIIDPNDNSVKVVELQDIINNYLGVHIPMCPTLNMDYINTSKLNDNFIKNMNKNKFIKYDISNIHDIERVAQYVEYARSRGFLASIDYMDNYTANIHITRADYLSIMLITHVGKESQRCIYIDDPDHIYITEGFIPTHNTTLADQIAFNIIKNFEDGLMAHIDAERTALRQRLCQVTGSDIADERIKIKKENTSVEDVLDMFTKICDAKEAGGKAYKYDAPIHAYNGKTYKVYIPTVFIIDSVVSFNSKEYSVDDLGTNMDGARSAKVLTRFVNNCLDRMQRYNITIIMISHIRTKVEANPYATTPPGLMMLKPGESVPGGMNLQYMCQNFFRINMLKSNAYTKDEVGFNGFKAGVQIAKSKTNCVGTTIDVAFNSEFGFDPIFTLYEFANSIGLIQGRNPYLYFQGLDTMKFSRKDFRHKFMEEKSFRDEIFTILKPHFEALLGAKESTTTERMRYGDLASDSENNPESKEMKKSPKKVKLEE